MRMIAAGIVFISHISYANLFVFFDLFNQVEIVELPFYFAFPYLLRLFNKIRPERLLVWAAGIVLAIFCAPFVPRGPPACRPA